MATAHERVVDVIIGIFFDPKYYDHSEESIKSEIEAKRQVASAGRARLAEDLQMDSLYLMDFVTTLQEQAKRQMTANELSAMKTIQDAVDWVSRG